MKKGKNKSVLRVTLGVDLSLTRADLKRLLKFFKILL